jgi:hypothetical protein
MQSPVFVLVLALQEVFEEDDENEDEHRTAESSVIGSRVQ